MTAIALVTLFLLRIAVPFGILLAIGEWIHRHEAKYWFRR